MRMHLVHARRSAAVVAWAMAMLTGVAHAAPRPYDEHQDAAAAVHQAAAAAEADKQHVLLIFGANWCPDCLALDQALQRPDTAAWLHQRFKVVKIDVGNFNRNQSLNQRFGDPIRMGIPAAVVLDGHEHVLYATQGGELSEAHRMGPDGIARFLLKVLGDLP